MHNEHVSSYEQVSLFKAVEVNHQMMSHVGDYVAYINEDDEEEEVYLYSFLALANVSLSADVVWKATGMLYGGTESTELCSDSEIREGVQW